MEPPRSVSSGISGAGLTRARLASITRFFRNESCGKCVPCRVGTEKAVALIEKAGCVSAEDEALLRSLHETMGQTSICGLGQVALGPLLSILSRFPDRMPRAPAVDGGGDVGVD